MLKKRLKIFMFATLSDPMKVRSAIALMLALPVELLDTYVTDDRNQADNLETTWTYVALPDGIKPKESEFKKVGEIPGCLGMILHKKVS